MVGIQEPLPVSRVINRIVPVGQTKGEGRAPQAGSTKGLTALKTELCWAHCSPPSGHPRYLLLQEVQDLQSKGLSRIFCNTNIQKHQFFGAQLSL